MKDTDITEGQNLSEVLNGIFKKFAKSQEKISKILNLQKKYLLNKVKQERPTLI